MRKSRGWQVFTLLLGLLAALPPATRAQILTDSRKASIGALEMAFFGGAIKNDTFYKESGYYAGQWYEIYKSTSDPDLHLKIPAIHAAVKAVSDRGVKIPYGLRVYCTDWVEAQNRAFPRTETWEPVSFIVLKWARTPDQPLDSLSSKPFLDFNRPTITAIHEMGHILHERRLGDAFFAPNSILTGPAQTASKVNGYAGNSKKEFVAEVFTGLVMGKTWPTDVLNEYRRLGGPPVPGARR